MKLYVVQIFIVTKKEQAIVSAWAEALLAPSEHLAVTDVVYRVRTALGSSGAGNDYTILPVRAYQVSDSMIVTANAVIQVSAVDRMRMIGSQLEAMYGSVCPVCGGTHVYNECPDVRAFIETKRASVREPAQEPANVRETQQPSSDSTSNGSGVAVNTADDVFNQLLRDMRSDWTDSHGQRDPRA